jgi:hypothetical protein
MPTQAVRASSPILALRSDSELVVAAKRTGDASSDRKSEGPDEDLERLIIVLLIVGVGGVFFACILWFGSLALSTR